MKVAQQMVLKYYYQGKKVPSIQKFAKDINRLFPHWGLSDVEIRRYYGAILNKTVNMSFPVNIGYLS